MSPDPLPLPLFVFGTLRHAPLCAAVAGVALPARPAALAGHRVARALAADGRPQPFPVLAAAPGAVAPGLLLHPDPEARARLHAYERLFRYHPVPHQVLCDGRPVTALIYLPEGDSWRPGPDWDIDLWAADWAALRTEAAARIMAHWPDWDGAAMARRYPMVEMAAASALRAAGVGAGTAPNSTPNSTPTLTPASLRRAAAPGDVAIRATRRPYAAYFGVQEDDLDFRRFDGGRSAVVTRAGFVMADAVTVLPYDPVRDAVLLVEQFRYGAWLRGDPNPWSLEPVAGRIDPGESPEAAARREAREEARLDMAALHRIAGYYPSPAAVTEYLVSFVGIADLGPGSEGLGGLTDEAEDIRAHVVGFDRLMGLIASGEVANGPLLVSAFWLAGQRAALRDARPGRAPA